MNDRKVRRRAATILGVAALLLAAGPRRSADAHDATEAPPRGPDDAGHAGAVAGTATGSAATAPAPAPAPFTWPLVVVGAGAIATAAGSWWLYDESHQKAGSCVVSGLSSRESCGSPSVGPSLGLAMVLVGAQVTVGGLVWLGVRWHGRRPPVALELGPRTLALRAAF
jgi:hypothetical protein